MNHRILIVEDKLLGYELEADDYVTKPFSMSVLYAKVSALIRRSRRPPFPMTENSMKS